MRGLLTTRFELIEDRSIWIKVRHLAGLELAEVVAVSTEPRAAFPIGAVVRVGGRWDASNVVEEFPLEPVGGLIGIGLVLDFLAKRASFSDLREAVRVSTQAEHRAVFSSSEE